MNIEGKSRDEIERDSGRDKIADLVSGIWYLSCLPSSNIGTLGFCSMRLAGLGRRDMVSKVFLYLWSSRGQEALDLLLGFCISCKKIK